MKKAVSILVVVCMLLVTFCSCQSNISEITSTDPASDPSTSTTKATPTTVSPTTIPESTDTIWSTEPVISYDKEGVPLYSWNLDPNELTQHYFSQRVAEAKGIFDSNEVLRLNCNDYTYYCISENQDLLGDSVTTEGDTFVIHRSNDPECSRTQLLLIVAVMVSEKWADSVYHRAEKYDGFSGRRHFQYIHYVGGYRSSGYTSPAEYFDDKNDLADFQPCFTFSHYSGGNVLLSMAGAGSRHTRIAVLDIALTSLYNYRPWTEERKSELEAALIAERGQPIRLWYSENSHDAMLYGMRYYGEFDGYEILYIPSWSREYRNESINNVTYKYYGVGAEFLAYKDNKFIKMEDAANQHLRGNSELDILSIHEHIEQIIRMEEQSWNQTENKTHE